MTFILCLCLELKICQTDCWDHKQPTKQMSHSPGHWDQELGCQTAGFRHILVWASIEHAKAVRRVYSGRIAQNITPGWTVQRTAKQQEDVKADAKQQSWEYPWVASNYATRLLDKFWTLFWNSHPGWLDAMRNLCVSSRRNTAAGSNTKPSTYDIDCHSLTFWPLADKDTLFLFLLG